MRRTGRKGGRPPDSRNLVFLKSLKVVKKKNIRTGLAKIKENIPHDFLEENVEDTGERTDLVTSLLEDKGVDGGEFFASKTFC